MTFIRNTLNLLLDGYSLILVARVLFPLLNMDRHRNALTRSVYRLTDFALKPIQQVIPPMRFGDVMLDFAPLIVLLLINLVQTLL